MIKSCLPTFFGNNWYLTCYLLFYPLHPVLNSIIAHMDKRALFRASFALFTIYFIFSSLGGAFFSSTIISWVAMYFVIAYSKNYMPDQTNDLPLIVRIMIVSFLCFIGAIVLTNQLCLHVPFFTGRMFHWNKNNNPFIFFLSFSMFLAAKQLKLKNSTVNYISGLSLLIYIFHENLILKTYFRPLMINYIYSHFGYAAISFWVILSYTALCMCAFGSMLYLIRHSLNVIEGNDDYYSIYTLVVEMIDTILQMIGSI